MAVVIVAINRGTGYFDEVNNCIVGDPSTSAMDGSTEEEQF